MPGFLCIGQDQERFNRCSLSVSLQRESRLESFVSRLALVFGFTMLYLTGHAPRMCRGGLHVFDPKAQLDLHRRLIGKRIGADRHSHMAAVFSEDLAQ